MRLCGWKCGRPTSNHSGICSPCWQAAAPLRARSDEGYRVWLEHYRAKQAAKKPKPRSEAQRLALEKRNRQRAAAKTAISAKDLRSGDVSQPETIED